MSRCTEIPFTCPNCHRSSGFVVWQSLNVTLEPELKDLLLDGRLLTFTCPHCTFSQVILYPLLYHDMLAGFMIWLVPADEHGQQSYDRATLGQYAKAMPGYCLRLVPTFNRLLEKICILDSKLDDRVFELVKHDYWAAHLVDQGIQEDWLYISKITHGVEYPVIQLSAIIPDGGKRTFTITGMGGYPRAVELLHNEFKVPVLEETGWRIIDHHYWNLLKKESNL